MLQRQNTDGKITVIPPTINASVAPGKIVGEIDGRSRRNYRLDTKAPNSQENVIHFFSE